MSYLSQFMPKSGPWVRNPSEMGSLYSNTHIIKSAAGTLVDVMTDTTFTATIPLQGAYATIAANDTFVTVCDLTGGGICSAIIGAAAGANNDISTIEVTVDGVVYTITHTLADANYRRVVGLMTNAGSTTAGNASGPNDGEDYPIDIANISKTPVIVWPVSARTFGLPALRFDSSLKVRCKITTKSGTAAYTRCAALYTMD